MSIIEDIKKTQFLRAMAAVLAASSLSLVGSTYFQLRRNILLALEVDEKVNWGILMSRVLLYGDTPLRMFLFCRTINRLDSQGYLQKVYCGQNAGIVISLTKDGIIQRQIASGIPRDLAGIYGE